MGKDYPLNCGINTQFLGYKYPVKNPNQFNELAYLWGISSIEGELFPISPINLTVKILAQKKNPQ